MKVAIVGSRMAQETHYEKLVEKVPAGISEIITGGARGVDALAARYAKENGVKLTEYLPDYQKYGKSAPFMRNKEIIAAADYVLCFWDGKSKGTQSIIGACLKQNKPVKVILLESAPLHTAKRAE